MFADGAGAVALADLTDGESNTTHTTHTTTTTTAPPTTTTTTRTTTATVGSSIGPGNQHHHAAANPDPDAFRMAVCKEGRVFYVDQGDADRCVWGGARGWWW